ncbi:hypothetical protein [Bremerella sp.]
MIRLSAAIAGESTNNYEVIQDKIRLVAPKDAAINGYFSYPIRRKHNI